MFLLQLKIGIFQNDKSSERCFEIKLHRHILRTLEIIFHTKFFQAHEFASQSGQSGLGRKASLVQEVHGVSLQLNNSDIVTVCRVNNLQHVLSTLTGGHIHVLIIITGQRSDDGHGQAIESLDNLCSLGMAEIWL